jgi:exosome complex component RRP41
LDLKPTWKSFQFNSNTENSNFASQQHQRRTMPLDSSSYALAHLRVDGRRWNELRRIHGQMSTQAAADGSSYFEMGNTKVMCTVHGPRQQTKGGGSGQSKEATIEVEIGIAGFSGMDRKKRSRMDK